MPEPRSLFSGLWCGRLYFSFSFSLSLSFTLFVLSCVPLNFFIASQERSHENCIFSLWNFSVAVTLKERLVVAKYLYLSIHLYIIHIDKSSLIHTLTMLNDNHQVNNFEATDSSACPVYDGMDACCNGTLAWDTCCDPLNRTVSLPEISFPFRTNNSQIDQVCFPFSITLSHTHIHTYICLYLYTYIYMWLERDIFRCLLYIHWWRGRYDIFICLVQFSVGFIYRQSVKDMCLCVCVCVCVFVCVCMCLFVCFIFCLLYHYLFPHYY